MSGCCSRLQRPSVDQDEHQSSDYRQRRPSADHQESHSHCGGCCGPRNSYYSPYGYSAPHGDCRRRRTVYTPDQLVILEEEYEKDHYMDCYKREELAHRLGLSEPQVKVWFQNRRARDKKEGKMDYDDDYCPPVKKGRNTVQLKVEKLRQEREKAREAGESPREPFSPKNSQTALLAHPMRKARIQLDDPDAITKLLTGHPHVFGTCSDGQVLSIFEALTPYSLNTLASLAKKIKNEAENKQTGVKAVKKEIEDSVKRGRRSSNQ